MAYDIYWDKVVLAMHMDDTGLTDVKGHTVTLNGAAARSATQSKFGGYSASLNGSTSYLRVTDAADLQLGTGDFTIETFFYMSAYPAAGSYFAIASKYAGLNSRWVIYLGNSVASDSGIKILMGNGSTTLNAGTTDQNAALSSLGITTGTWHHVAAVRNGGVVTVYLNGVAQGKVTTINYDASYATANVDIGAQNAALFFNGYIDDLLITKGVARYTANFTPPSAAFAERLPVVSGVVRDAANNLAQKLVRVHDRNTAALLAQTASNPTTGAYSVNLNTDKEVYAIAYDATSYDIYWDKVVLAMHMDDTRLSDVKGHVVSLNGNVTRSATQSKFGGYSAYFDGVDDYLLVTGNSDFNLSTGDWTIEMFLYRTASGASQTLLNLANAAGANSGLNFWINASNQLVQDNGVTGTTAAGTVPANAWTHVAACRYNGNTQLYIDGTAVGSPITQAPNAAIYAYIGVTSLTGTADYAGYIDDLRITKGVARYTANFTPPTAAFPDGVVGGTENAVILDRLVPA